MRLSILKSFYYLFFLFIISHTAAAIIIVPRHQSLTISHYEDEPISLSHGATVNILPGGSVEMGEIASDSGYINVLGGKIRNRLHSGHFNQGYTLNVMGGHIAGLSASGATSDCTVIVSGGSADVLSSTCHTYISGGIFNGFVGPEWGGSINISGGVFNDYLYSIGGGSYEISGGKFNNPRIYFTWGWTMDFFGYDLTITDPFNITSRSYERQIVGHLLDGRYIDMNVLVENEDFSIEAPEISDIRVHNVDGDYSHKTVPEPSTLILLGAGIIGIGATRLRKTK